MMSLWPGTLPLVLLAVGTSQSVDVDSLSVGTSQSFTENWLTSIMDTLLREYRFTGQFCLMVNIPATTQPQQLLNVLTNDRYQNVLNVVGTREDDDSRVYVGSNVIVARPNLEGHAEQRAMQQIELLHHNQQQTGRVFLMYSFLSPCGDHCATMEGDNILEPFQDQVMTHWSRGQYILVFNRVFDNPGSGRRPTEKELKKPLEQLKMAEFRNIFRCFGPSGSFKCHECFTGNQLNNVCINNSASPDGQGGSNPTGGRGSSSNIFGQGHGSRTQGQGGNSPTGGQGGNSPTGGQGDRQAKRPRKT